MPRLSRLAALLALTVGLAACDTGPLDSLDIETASIRTIQVDDFSFSNPEGNPWDGIPDTAPDVYITLETAEGDVFFESEEIPSTTVGDLPLVFDFIDRIQINNLRRGFVVAIWDRDAFNADDLIGETDVFVFEDYLPEGSDVDDDFTFAVGGDGGITQVRLRGEWRD